MCRGLDLEIGGPITPLHLMQGRSMVEVPDFCNTKAHLLTLLTFIQDVKQTFGPRGITWCRKAWTRSTSEEGAADDIFENRLFCP